MRRLFLVALALTILLPLLAVMLVFLAAAGESAAQCGIPLGAAGPVGGVPAADVPIFQGAAARFGLGARGPSILAAINYVESTFGTQTRRVFIRAPTAPAPKGRCSSSPAPGDRGGAGARRPARATAEHLRRGRRGVQRRELPEGLRRARRLAGRDLRLQPLERIRAAGPLAGAELLHPRAHRPGIRHLDDTRGPGGLGERGQPVQRPGGERRPGGADHARARTADDRRRDRTSPTPPARGATTCSSATTATPSCPQGSRDRR